MYKMKKVVLFLLMLFCITSTVMAEEYPKDIPLPYQEKTTLTDTKNLFKIYISEDNKKFVLTKGSFDYYTATVPVEFFSKKTSPHGGDVKVEGDFVTLTKGDTVLKYRLGSNIVNANGKNISLLGRCYKLNNTIQVPLRFTLESFGGSITESKQTFYLPGYMWFNYPKGEKKRTAYIKLSRTKKVTPALPKFSDNFDSFAWNTYSSPDGKWRTKLGRLHDYDTIILEDVERGLFYPIIGNMREQLGRSWLQDNRLLIHSQYVKYGKKPEHKKDLYTYYVYDPALKEMKKISKQEADRLSEYKVPYIPEEIPVTE